jgi:type IV secretory pathway component VirB8
MLSYVSSRITPLLPLQKYLKYVVKVSNEDEVQRPVKTNC